jgi:signal transduction histidine kinase
VAAAFSKAIESHQQLRAEIRMRHVDGHYVQFETIGRFLFDETGKYIGSVYIARDITERNRLQEALIQQEKLTTALEKEQELNQLKNRMMLRIDHEFRTPLTVIRSMAYTLDAYADRLGAEQRHVKVDAIQRQVERIVLMLDAIRSVLTGAYAVQRIHRLPVRLIEVCRSAIRDVEAHVGTSGRLLMNVPEDLIVDVDPQALKEAIYKVLVNALLYSSPPDLVHVTAEPVDGEVHLRVIDCGIGILENEQSRIFEPFFRGSNIGEVSGIGLGLTIAKASVESYGGRIEIDSQPSKGTTIRLRLPIPV